MEHKGSKLKARKASLEIADGQKFSDKAGSYIRVLHCLKKFI